MIAINDPILAQGEVWKAQLAGRQTMTVAIEPEVANPQIETDPFTFTEEEVREFSSKPNLGLIPFVKAAINKGFHVFALTPKDKHPLPGSQGFKNSRSPNDSNVLAPWNDDPNRNIGIDLGASDLCVLDF